MISLPFSNPKVRAIVQAAFPGAKSRRPVKIKCRQEYMVNDFWDGGSRSYCAFVRLDTLEALSSEAMPKSYRQIMGNPFGLPIGTILIQPNFAVVEHSIFRGKDFGFSIFINNISELPEANQVPQLHIQTNFGELSE